MPDFILRLRPPAKVSPEEARRSFVWSGAVDDSFATNLGPSLGKLGPIPKPNIELVRVAAAVLAADRSWSRQGQGSNWSRREFHLSIPVFDPDRWHEIQEPFTKLLNFLTGDSWNLEFTGGKSPSESVAKAPQDASRAVLLSGGADSAVGGLLARNESGSRPYTLVSHVGATNLAPIQRTVAGLIQAAISGGEQRHQQIQLTRARKRIDGKFFPSETSTRSRSLLFIALGLAIASLNEAELWVPENGFASINPPLAADQRGSLSTRTTHPAFLGGLQEVLPRAGVHCKLSNPLHHMTKGEVFQAAIDLIGDAAATSLFSETHSCAHTGQRAHGVPIRVQCGVCFGCLVRRSAFLSTGLTDKTEYLVTSRPDLSEYRARKSMLRHIEEFLERGVRPAEVSALSLPVGVSGSDAIGLCERTIEELRTLVS